MRLINISIGKYDAAITGTGAAGLSVGAVLATKEHKKAVVDKEACECISKRLTMLPSM